MEQIKLGSFLGCIWGSNPAFKDVRTIVLVVNGVVANLSAKSIEDEVAAKRSFFEGTLLDPQFASCSVIFIWHTEDVASLAVREDDAVVEGRSIRKCVLNSVVCRVTICLRNSNNISNIVYFVATSILECKQGFDCLIRIHINRPNSDTSEVLAPHRVAVVRRSREEISRRVRLIQGLPSTLVLRQELRICPQRTLFVAEFAPESHVQQKY